MWSLSNSVTCITGSSTQRWVSELLKTKVLRFSFSKANDILIMASMYRISYTISLYCQVLPSWLSIGIQKLDVLICFPLSPLVPIPGRQAIRQTRVHGTQMHLKHNGAGHVRIWTRSIPYCTHTLHRIIFSCVFPIPHSNVVERDRDNDWKTRAEFTVLHVHKNIGDACHYFQKNHYLKYKN